MILEVKAEICDEITAELELYGVLVVEKPISRAVFWNALRLASAVYHKLYAVRQKNRQLAQQIQDIRRVDRVKCVLMETLQLTASQAHRYIEKQAMDLRKS